MNKFPLTTMASPCTACTDARQCTEAEHRTPQRPASASRALEHSNVNPTMEMIRLMTAYREFESVQKSVRTIDADMNGRLIQELGRLS